MPTYSTPDPIVAVIEFEAGDVRILASERDDTVVEVRPSDESRDNDVRAAEETRVEYSAGRLLVKGPKQRNPFGKPGSRPPADWARSGAKGASATASSSRAWATSWSPTPARWTSAPGPAP